MNEHHVIVWGIETGPGVPTGRTVEVDAEEIGTAVTKEDLVTLLAEHDVYDLEGVIWRDGGPDDWP
ncbi:hypothetical protein [Streptacidiphilus rugosus]|uniref:hypothetical protein n=1 Tax=Streptacidiphilus rugosus TaxID=405783 RepID=UPI0005604FF3|nr:hypothetical protein [Streptacidiphilus rugosus]